VKLFSTLFVALFLVGNVYAQSPVDKELNEVYHQVLIAYKENNYFVKQLRVVERKWIEYRDEQLKLAYPEDDEGHLTVRNLCMGMYYESLTRERISSLKELLLDREEGEVCYVN
jgi:uncharacterized protein YecT (DUF1311 family)